MAPAALEARRRAMQHSAVHGDAPDRRSVSPVDHGTAG